MIGEDSAAVEKRMNGIAAILSIHSRRCFSWDGWLHIPSMYSSRHRDQLFGGPRDASSARFYSSRCGKKSVISRFSPTQLQAARILGQFIRFQQPSGARFLLLDSASGCGLRAGSNHA